MGFGFRVFFIDEDDSTIRTTLARFERLRNHDPKEQLPQYANKKIRFAMAVLEVEGKKPLSVVQIDYGYLSFDSEGRLDPKYLEDEMRIAMGAVPFISLPDSLDNTPKNVINAQHKFAIKKYKNLFSWKPSPEIEKEIYNSIFGK